MNMQRNKLPRDFWAKYKALREACDKQLYVGDNPKGAKRVILSLPKGFKEGLVFFHKPPEMPKHPYPVPFQVDDPRDLQIAKLKRAFKVLAKHLELQKNTIIALSRGHSPLIQQLLLKTYRHEQGEIDYLWHQIQIMIRHLGI